MSVQDEGRLARFRALLDEVETLARGVYGDEDPFMSVVRAGLSEARQNTAPTDALVQHWGRMSSKLADHVLRAAHEERQIGEIIQHAAATNSI